MLHYSGVVADQPVRWVYAFRFVGRGDELVLSMCWKEIILEFGIGVLSEVGVSELRLLTWNGTTSSSVCSLLRYHPGQLFSDQGVCLCVCIWMLADLFAWEISRRQKGCNTF